MNRRVETNNKSNPAAKSEKTEADLFFRKILKIIVILMVLVLPLFVQQAFRRYEQMKVQEKVQHSIIKTNGIITHYDEILTMSAKMAAATGDLSWEDRYRSFEPKLDAAIKNVMDISPEQFINKAAAQTDSANIKLVALENEAFDLVRKGNLSAASELLNSQEYEKQKHLYHQGLEQCASTLERYMEAESDKYRKSLLGLIIFVSFNTLLVICSSLSILRMRKTLHKRKQAEKQIQEQNEFLNNVLESIPSPMYVIDVNDYTIKMVNSAACSKELSEKTTCYMLSQKRDNPCHGADDQCPIEEIKRTKKSVTVEHVHYDEDGNPRNIEVHGYPIFDRKGNLIQMIEYSIDITERKRAEDSLKLAYKELEQANMELKETQSQLVQSEKLASIGQLAAGIAHEINNPVGFIAGNFQTLERHTKKILDLLAMHDKLAGQVETSGNPELATIIEGIGEFREDMQIDFILEDIQRLFVDSKEGVERTVKIIQNLRDFSRIDQPGSRDEYDLNEGIKATLVVARNEIKYDADVITEFSEVPLIYCHCGQINQVLLNIFVNAAQAIKSQEREDRGTITIRTYASDDGVVCEISDDGPGIPPDKISKVFDPFFTTKPPGKGTGLGLSVSYGIIVNKHNGELLVDSTAGEGTKFTIKLPIGTKENDEEEYKDEKETMSYGKENSIIC